MRFLGKIERKSRMDRIRNDFSGNTKDKNNTKRETVKTIKMAQLSREDARRQNNQESLCRKKQQKNKTESDLAERGGNGSNRKRDPLGRNLNTGTRQDKINL